ncbi:hypothetical protein MATL_G00096850 [Megalops atlanticus]|uniref:SCP domain-containing protein n=1 Tax=Megalops atlanticus TaxID=7932 RepID=A0A9D3Q3N8_MEGAT|nr:hypothetical protein MATL_G00096850 [Megalops atlanticus]
MSGAVVPECCSVVGVSMECLYLLLTFVLSLPSSYSQGNWIVNEKRTNAPARGLGAKEHFQIVTQHNRLRSRVNPMAANMQKMEWSEKLALLAQERVASCSTDPTLQEPHSDHIGWNTHHSSLGTTSFAEVIDTWFQEGRRYSYLSGQCEENSTCQHYTQLVWATSSRVGCAQQVCQTGAVQWEFYACAYSPGGNWEVNGRMVVPYKAGAYCSLCTSDMSGCFRLWDHVGGLCGETLLQFQPYHLMGFTDIQRCCCT